MLPFLELPMIMANNEGKEMEVTKRVQPSEISDYYPGFYVGTIIVMKSGSSWLCPLPIEDIDAALAACHSALKSNTGKFGNLKLSPKKPLLHATS